MDSIEVSLVIPVYNGEKYLKKCIDSVIMQTCFDSMEIIIIDDGSTDDTSAICDAYANLYKNVTVIHQKNEGLVNARKIGVKQAKGIYITFVDADDWIDKDLVEKMLRAANRYNADMIVSGLVYEYPDSSAREKKYSIPAGIYRGTSIVEFQKKYVYSDSFFDFGTCVSIWGKLFRLDKYRYFQLQIPEEVKIGEDVAVTVPYVSRINRPIVILDNTYYHYRQLEFSMVHQYNNPKREEESMLLYSVIEQNLKRNPVLLERIEYYKASMLIGLLKNNINIANNKKEKLDHVREILTNQYYQRGLRKLDYKTMSLRYRLFFAAVRMKMSYLVMLILQKLNKEQ